MLRLTSEFWVSALCRKVATEGAFAYVAKRGASEAGAIFILLDDLQNNVQLYAPAPQFGFDGETSGDRLFEAVNDVTDGTTAREKLEREQKFDPDLWIVEIEDRSARIFWEVVTLE